MATANHLRMSLSQAHVACKGYGWLVQRHIRPGVQDVQAISFVFVGLHCNPQGSRYLDSGRKAAKGTHSASSGNLLAPNLSSSGLPKPCKMTGSKMAV